MMRRIPLILLVLALCQPMLSRAATPTISFTHVPDYGDGSDYMLQGKVTNVKPADYRVAVYILVGDGWWTKPTFDYPTVEIANDSTWEVSIVTGGYDAFATAIAAFLIPKDVYPPPMNGGTTLPTIPQAVASVQQSRGPAQRTVSFAGYTWKIKRRDFPYDPGQNYWSDRTADIWVNSAGLHLTYKKVNEQWFATEAILNKSFGYGTYAFQTHGRLDNLDPRLVVGLFTWDVDAPEVSNRELDIEFARWDQPTDDGTNAQFVVHPVYDPWTSNRATRYTITQTDAACDLTIIMVWGNGWVNFKTYYGKWLNSTPPLSALVKDWTFVDSSVPKPGKENVRFNFWSMDSSGPKDGKNRELIISGFKYSSALPPMPSPIVIQFKNQPGVITTNLPDYPIFSYYPKATTVTVNGTANALDWGGFFQMVSLKAGGNKFTVSATSGTKVLETTTKWVIYDPRFRTDYKQLLYFRTDNGTVVINLDDGYVLGLMPHQIVAAANNGRYVVSYYGTVLNATSHKTENFGLPFSSSPSYPFFSPNDTFCFYGKEKVRFATRTLEPTANIISIFGWRTRPLAGNQVGVADNDYLYVADLGKNTLLSKTQNSYSSAFVVTSAIDPRGKYGLTTSYGWASGNLDIVSIPSGTLTTIYSLSDYMGQIAFSADKKKALVGSYGNSWYGGGGVYIVDLASQKITRIFGQFGASSVAVGQDGLVYASAHFVDHFGDGTHLVGMPDRRGVDVFVVSGDNASFQKSYFLNLPHNYSTGPDFLLKPAGVKSNVLLWHLYE